MGLSLTATAALLPPSRSVPVLAALAVGTLALVFPPAALVGVAFSVPFSNLLRLPAGGQSLSATELAVIFLATVWALRAAARQRTALRAGHVWVPLGLFLGIALLSMSVAQDLGLTAKEIVKWAEFGLMVVLVASVVERPRDAVIAVAAILAAGCIEALYGLGQAATGAGPAGFLIGGNLLRAFGHFGQPNPFAAYVATGLLVASGIGIALMTRSPRSLLSPTGVLVALVGGVLFLALLASLSRSAWIAVAAAVVVMLVAHDRRTAPLVGLGFLLALLLGLVGLFGLLPPVVTSRFTVLLDNFALFDARSVTLSAANFALVQRMAIWQAAWEIYQQHPVLGIGLGNFDVVYPSYALPGWPQLPGHAHNYYLNLLAELGVLGLSAYVVLLGWLYVSVWRAVQQAKAALGQPEMPTLAVYGAALGALGVLVLLTVHHLFDNLYVHGIIVQIGMLVGLALAAPRLLGQRNQPYPYPI